MPLPPEMIAPAWPIRLPGGAVRPAMNAATGLVTCSRDEGGGLFLGGAADLADHQIASVCGSSSNSFSRSMNDGPTIGSPPRPTQVDWPRPSCVSCQTAS